MDKAGGGEPKQHLEVAPQPGVGEATEEQVVEHQRPASQESTAGKQATPAALQPLPAIPDLPVAAPVVLPQDDTVAPVSSPASAKIPAAERDRIEKQWVDKAKQIVAQTKDDPYKQKTEMSKIKADYIGKRYNKAIKTDDAVAA